MPKYILVYHGGEKPVTEDTLMKANADWETWVSSLGELLIGAGAGMANNQTISSDGKVTEGGGANPCVGYCVIQAADQDHAIQLAKTHPFLQLHGSIEVAEAHYNYL